MSPIHKHETSKATKESVDYSKGMPESHCGICEHFRAPHSCTEVQGKIDKSMWCKRFKKAKRG